MAGIQRFVTYIYAYENGQKYNNAGYAKVETRGNNGRMEIHFADDGVANGVGKVSFLYIKDKKLVSIPIGEISFENGRGAALFTFHTEMLQNTAVSFHEIDGIGINDSNHQTYMSFWKDVEVPEAAAMQPDSEEAGSEAAEEIEIQPQQEALSQKEMIEEAEQESLHTMEIPMRNVFPTYTLDAVWKSMAKNTGCVQINDDVCAIQMELSGLRELPQKYWYFGNNSFLLHGFFNYHHLLWGKLPNGKWFLGVPGVYHRQERVMASIFGFPGFLPLAEASSENDNMREMQQGIWYHILED